MADLLNTDFGNLAGQAASAGYTIVMTIIGICIVAGILALIYIILQYKHRVRVKVLTKNGFYVIQDKAREIKDSTTHEVKFWKLWNLKETVTIPPPASVCMTKKGKFTADAYWSEETGLVWVTDNVTRENFKKLVVETVTTKDKNGKDVTSKVAHDATQPFTTQERALQAWRITQAQNRKRKNIWETIAQIATPIVLAMLFICVLVFWEDIAKPAKDMAQSNLEISKQNAAIAEQNARILAMITNNEIEVNQVITAKTTTGGKTNG